MSPTVILTWHACKYQLHKLHQRYILLFRYGYSVVDAVVVVVVVVVVLSVIVVSNVCGGGGGRGMLQSIIQNSKRQERLESARQQRIALYKSDQ